MPDSPNAAATTADFEFAALDEARNYRDAIVGEFRAFLRGNVIEIGAGIGQITAQIAALPEVEKLVAVEPDERFSSRHRELYPAHNLVEGTIEAVGPGDWNAIVSVNVLEHIEHDESELAKYAALLRPAAGRLCILVPARPEIYAPIDKDFGHFRRYTKPELRRKLTEAGFKITRLHYYNCAGYFAWWANFCLLKKRGFEPAKVRAYDRLVFPLVHAIESRVCRPAFGQSLIAIAQAV
jgi:SAM-dependent methyltransferase